MSNAIIRDTTLFQNQLVKSISKNIPENAEIEAHIKHNLGVVEVYLGIIQCTSSHVHY